MNAPVTICCTCFGRLLPHPALLIFALFFFCFGHRLLYISCTHTYPYCFIFDSNLFIILAKGGSPNHYPSTTTKCLCCIHVSRHPGPEQQSISSGSGVDGCSVVGNSSIGSNGDDNDCDKSQAKDLMITIIMAIIAMI